MGKKRNTFLKTVGVGAIASIAAMAATNKYLTEKEKKNIYNYGTKVNTEFGNMNVSIMGEGKDTIVLLPGYGTASPILDFEPLAKTLSEFAKVVTVEYLGYGDSDDTDRERTVENICEELHCLLSELHIKKYWLMPHSISGVYALAYSNYYPEEVRGVLLIDTSVPKQVDKANPAMETILTKVLHSTGLGRLIMHFKPETFVGSEDVYEKEVLSQMKLRTLQKPTKAIENEGALLAMNMEKTREMKFDDKLPVLLFLCAGTVEKTKNWWLEIHEEQMENLETSALVMLEGEHYLHRTNAQRMADEVDDFMTFISEAEILGM